MNRRRWVGAGVGLAALAAGAGVAVWRGRSNGAPASVDLWSTAFEQPTGGEFVLAKSADRPLLLNFWATWCPPCVREMPLLEHFHREQGAGGWRVVGLAVDRLEPVRDFLRSTPVSYPIGLANAQGLTLVRQLGNEAGGLPYTVVLDGDGHVLHRRLGGLEPGELESWSRRLG